SAPLSPRPRPLVSRPMPGGGGAFRSRAQVHAFCPAHRFTPSVRGRQRGAQVDLAQLPGAAVREQPAAAAGSLARAQLTLSARPPMTSPLSRTRIGTPRCPLSCSTSARSCALEGQVQNLTLPPLTCLISYW